MVQKIKGNIDPVINKKQLTAINQIYNSKGNKQCLHKGRDAWSINKTKVQMNKIQINLGIYFCFFSLYTMTLYQSESLKKREKRW